MDKNSILSKITIKYNTGILMMDANAQYV